MLLQALFMMGIMLNTIQTVIDIRDKNSRHNRENIIPFNVFPEKLTSSQCHIEESKVRFEHYLFETCPTTYDATCNDPMFNKYQEFEFRCRFPMMSNSTVTVNSTTFVELLRLRDPFSRDWCMIVMFYSKSCPFSARLAPHFNKIAGKYENLLPVAVEATDFSKLNFRYGVSGTPTVLLWVNGIGGARMGNKALDFESIKLLIETHTDLVELKDDKSRESNLPEKIIKVGGILKSVELDPQENELFEALLTFGSFLICFATFIYHVRERILLSAPVLQWLQSKCGGPLCDDIYFLFYVVPPRHQNRGAPPPPPAPEAAAPNDDVVELPPLVIDEDQ